MPIFLKPNRSMLSTFVLTGSLVCSVVSAHAQTTAVQTAPKVDYAKVAREMVHQPKTDAEAVRQADGSLIIRWVGDAKSIRITQVDPRSGVPLPGKPIRVVQVGKPSATVREAKSDKSASYQINRVDRAFNAHVTIGEKGTYDRDHSLTIPANEIIGRHPVYALFLMGGVMDAKTIVVAERFVNMPGAANVRDLGGYATTTGKHTRWGWVYRADSLAHLTPEAANALDTDLHIRLICDLRHPAEIAAAPDNLPTTHRPESLNASLSAENPLDRKAMAKFLTPDPNGSRNSALGASYVQMLEERGAALRPYFERLADRKNLPTLLHCTAGKDRTGVTSALLLALCGVPKQTILDDYSLTNLTFDGLARQLATNLQMVAAGMTIERLGPAMLADPAWMDATLNHIETTYGSKTANKETALQGAVRQYLKQKVGLDDTTLNLVVENLTE